jgi:succinyl-CoA synthetase beta subunit
MKIHEYQSKQLFRAAGVPVPPGHVARSGDEAAKAFDHLAGSLAVVKAQIHAGGRGKGRFKEHPDLGGVKLVRSAAEAREVAAKMLGSTLVTIQTGPAGKQVQAVYVEGGLELERELYLGIVVDRDVGGPVMMLSSEGGVEIEEVAQHSPEKILKEPIDVDAGLHGYQARKLAFALGLGGPQLKSAEFFLKKMARFFLDSDCSMAEINPLVITKSGEMVALDAKVTFDDNAMFRHANFLELRDLAEEDPAEVRAGAAGLSFVKLDGNIGCLVNGAGLAMSTMDLIKLHGGEPANFLDVGGGANADQVTEAFQILLSDANTKAVLVNIFGGIMRCTTIAEALLTAYEKVGFSVPLVVRLEGTEVEEGRAMLAKSGRPIINATDLTDAAKKVVAALGA